jgi:hypothetical protein
MPLFITLDDTNNVHTLSHYELHMCNPCTQILALIDLKSYEMEYLSIYLGPF